MVRIAYLDCVSGISGDMFVGALLDAGWPEDSLRRAVAWMQAEIAELRVETRNHRGFEGKGIVVRPAAAAPDHRSLREVLDRIEDAPLEPIVAQRAAAVFRRLAEAEARAHGCPIEEVRFHEVGAVDALVDVVGTCAGVHELGIERLHVSRLPLGSGTWDASHGAIPLPAPATALLLEGVPVRWTGVEGERCTPTGAALATTLGLWLPPPPMTVRRVGCGAGTRSFPDVPNLVRLFLGESSVGSGTSDPGHEGPPLAFDPGWETPSWGWERAPEDLESQEGCPGSWGRVVVLSTQIDDATPQEVAWLTERLRDSAALEVLVQPVSMKKDRTGLELTLIARPEQEEALMTRLLLLSPTLGVRRRLEWRRELDRAVGQVNTPFGPIQVKLARRGRGWTGEPEFESCKQAAGAAGVSLREIWRAAVRAIDSALETGQLGGS